QLGYLWQGGARVQLLEAVPSREYRTMVSSLGAGQGHPREGDVSPDGRLLALGMDEGDRLWDLASGRELAELFSKSYCVLVEADGHALLTCGATGLQRCPIEDSPSADKALRLGPPRPIELPFLPHRAALGGDERTLAVVSEMAGDGLLLDLP